MPLLRSNRRDLDPVYFALYGDIVYHHGAGFRAGTPSGVHRSSAVTPLPVPAVPGVGRLMEEVNRRRYRSWERRTQARRLEQSRRIYERIRAGGSDWLTEFA